MNGFEVEVKVLDINREQVEQKLLSLGAQKVFDGGIYTLYFSFPEEVPNRGRTLRLRQYDPETIEACIKGKKIDNKDGFKIRKEIPLNVDNFKGAVSFFEGLGFEISRETYKQRRSFSLPGTRFDLDEYNGIPPLLEIESQTPQQINRYLGILGFDSSQARDFSSRELEKHYQQLKQPKNE